MNTIGQRIKARRLQVKLTQKALGLLVGSTASAVTQWEQDSTQPKGENLLKLASVLGCSPEWIINGKDTPPPIDKIVSKGIVNVSELPIISWVQAGSWTDVSEISQYHDVEDWVETTLKVSDSAFALRVKGESMTSPTGMSIPEGSIAIVEPAFNGIDEALNRIVIARLDGSSEATIKKLISDGSTLYLKPLNPDFKVMEVDHNCRLVGIVKQIIIDL
ncbi:TPA: LexA family protein [Yersinia enterocolitica]